MNRYLAITDVYAREILDSRGNPTVEAQVIVNDRYIGVAAVPSGASTGKYEAVELRDGELRYMGLGVMKAVRNVNFKIKDVLVGKDALNQRKIDKILTETDGTENKSNLGANATLAVSMAAARAASKALDIPLYRYLGGIDTARMPVPMMNILNGGRHATNTVDFQEFMIMPVGALDFHDGLRMGAEIYHFLRQILNEERLSTAVGDEGGFAPDVKDTREVFRYLQKAVEKAGYHVGDDVVFAMDAAASELYDEETGLYIFPGESRAAGKEPEEGAGEGSAKDYCKDSVKRSADEMIALYEELIEEFPIVSIEDGLFEDDWEGWQKMTKRIGGRVQLVGDDLFVTNPKRIKCGIDLNVANAVLIKVNQIGTVTEAMEAIEMAKCAGYQAVISHRSGETEDAFIADLAVAVNAGQIKTGAPCRGERTAKYNQLLRIEEELKESARYGKAEIIRKK
ncbi:MAG: phosphopyruvate hydratase [Roseburia sp.]|nr:phosphopyruvate hydratase [Roseburia sp.]